MTETIKSTVITNLDATPPLRPITGEGGEAMLRAVSDYAPFATAEAAGADYRMCRMPRNAHVKHVYVNLDAAVTTMACDINIAWSDATNDGTTVTNQGTVPQISSANNKLFGSAIDLHAIVTPTDMVNKNDTNFPAGSQNAPLWQVLGYATDPGGYFDLYFVNTSTSSGSGNIEAEVIYTLG